MIKHCVSGISEFKNSEINELVECLKKEHELLLDPNKKELDLKVISCSFKNLTFPIIDYIKNLDFKVRFIKLSQKMESSLRQIILTANDKDIEIPPVIKARIQCKFSNKVSEKTIFLSHNSDNTHLQNAFAAVAHGMGYSTLLKARSTSVNTLGEQENCLVKTSSNLIYLNSDKEYQSTWVDKNSIKCMVQSTVNSARNWLADHIENKRNSYIEPLKECENYTNFCIDFTNLEEIVSKSRKAIGGYAITLTSDKDSKDVFDTLQDKVIKKIKQIEFRYKNSSFYSLYEKNIRHFECLAYWLLTRAYHVQGDIKNARENLEHLEKSKRSISNDIPIQMLYEVEKMVFDFFSGNPELIENQEKWLEQQDTWLTNMQNYIIERSHPEYGHYQGSCNLHIYACTSEIFGRIGRLNMRFDRGQFSILDNAIDNLLTAAHCCARIGHRKRLAHWLANASRAYCRINEGEQAKQLTDLAQSIINISIEPMSSDQYHQSVMAETNLACGERALLIDRDYQEANKYFLRALNGSMYLGFARIISESLYGISRASKELSIEELKVDFCKEIQLQELEQKYSHKNKIVKGICCFLNNLEDLENLENSQDVSREFMNQATKIWDDWYCEIHPRQPDKRHYISELMEEGKFLAKIPY
ncbi:MAG: hypothetical protein AAGA60_31365, partial [Cyanobacteria bacterium P01_E01_bin.42]